MVTTEQDLQLIDAVYGATTGENSLNEAVRSYLQLQRDPGGALFHFDSIADTSSDLEVIAVEDEMARLVQEVFDAYARKHGALDNPLISAGQDRLMAGDVLISDNVIPYEELQKTAYYKAVFEPLGVRRTMGWVAGGRWPGPEVADVYLFPRRDAGSVHPR